MIKLEIKTPRKSRTFVLLQSPVGGYVEMLEEHRIEPLIRTGWKRIPPKQVTF